MPISPVEALQRLNEPVLVKMPIRRTKSCTCSSQFFLDCEESVTTAGLPGSRKPALMTLPSTSRGRRYRSVALSS